MANSKTKPQFTFGFKHRWANAAFGVLEVLLAYIAASRAIDTGSWWQYLATLVFLLMAVSFFGKAIRNKA